MMTTCVYVTKPISSTIHRDLHRCKLFSNSTKKFCQLPDLRNGFVRQSLRLKRGIMHRERFTSWSKAKKKESEEGGKNEAKAVETVLKLYKDIKNKNMNGVAEVIGDECQCSCNFSSTFRLLQGKKQVMAFFKWLMKMLGKNLKLVVKPTSTNGMIIGVHWRLEWDKPNIPLGKGFSFHIFHVYQGKLLMKNLEMFMEPILHMEPLRLKTIAFAVRLAEKISTYMRLGESPMKQAMTLLLLSLVLLAVAVVYFTKPRFC